MAFKKLDSTVLEKQGPAGPKCRKMALLIQIVRGIKVRHLATKATHKSLFLDDHCTASLKQRIKRFYFGQQKFPLKTSSGQQTPRLQKVM
jgi:hypothetical protein